MDWQTHIRSTELRHHRSVLKTNHGMNNTLRLYEHMDILRFNIKKPLCLNNFQTFIYHCRRIRCNLVPHRPLRVRQRLLHRHLLQLGFRRLAKRPSRSSQKNCLHGSSLLTVQTLKNSGMFTVDRQNPYLMSGGKWHNNMSGRHQSLFIGKSNILSRLNGAHDRTKPNHSYHGGNDNLHFCQCGYMNKPVHSI